MMGPQHSRRPSLNSLKGLTNLRGPSHPKGPSNLRGPSNLKRPQQSEGPSNLRGTQQTEGPRQSEGRAPENCCHFAQAFVRCCQRGQPSSKLFNCYSLLWALSTTFNLHCLHVVEVVSDCCNMLTIIFKIEAHQKSSTKHWVRSKNGWATSMTMLSIENERARKLDTSNEVNILRLRKLVNTNFNFSELSYTSFQTSDLTLVLLQHHFFQSSNWNRQNSSVDDFIPAEKSMH